MSVGKVVSLLDAQAAEEKHFGDLADAMHEALVRDDDAESMRLLRQMPLGARMLMAIKYAMGADTVREWGLDTTPADAAYGPGWLDREGLE